MQIKIEIDVKPDELRRFLGLPDVAGLQEEIVAFLKEKVGQARETFDPATLVGDSLDALKRSKAFRRVLYGVDATEEDEGAHKSRRRSKRERGGAPE